MFKQFNNLPEKTIPDNTDILPIQQADGITYQITKENFLTGISGSGGSTSYIQLLDRKVPNANGGYAVAATWTNREINTIASDDTNSISLNSNAFILPSGIYIIDVASNFYLANAVKLRLINLTNNTVLLSGLNAYFNRNTPAYGNAVLSGKFVIDINQSLALQYYADYPASSPYNLGATVTDGSVETYTSINLWKVG